VDTILKDNHHNDNLVLRNITILNFPKFTQMLIVVTKLHKHYLLHKHNFSCNQNTVFVN